MSEQGILEIGTVAGGNLVQMVQANSAAYISTSSVIPFDNTIPQITEGAQLITLAITPQNAANTLYINAHMSGAVNETIAVGQGASLALFQDATANALATATAEDDEGGGGANFINTELYYAMVAGTVSSTTFQIRIGVSNLANTVYINGGSIPLYGGTVKLNLKIMEVI